MKSEKEAVGVLKDKVGEVPELLVILGSGWNKVLEGVQVEAELGFKEWLGVEATVPGHEGKVVVAQVAGKRVGFLQGRLHMYEGYSAHKATLPIRVLAEAGMKKMMVTAACGALNEKYKVGDFVLLSDLLTLLLSLDNPLKGPQFLDMSEVFEVKLRDIAREVMVELELSFHEGVYAYYHGPNFETPADKMALKCLGADVVGMSTVPETIMARWLKVEVIAMSFVTNLAFVKHDHKEVLAAAEKASAQMKGILEKLIYRLG